MGGTEAVTILTLLLTMSYGRGVVFIREKGTYSLSRDSSDDEQDFPLTGIEARNLYEEIISKPSEKKPFSEDVRSKGRAPVKRHRVSRKKKHSKNKLEESCSIPDSKPLASESDLFFYVQNNQLERLNEVLSRNLECINVRDKFHWTLLMVASYAGHRDIVELLLELGAQWEGVADKKGRNAVDLAKLGGYPHIVQLIEASHKCQMESMEEEHGLTRKKSRHEDMRPEKKLSFHCGCCQETVRGTCRTSHVTSTVHLFNCRYAHRVDLSYGISESNRGFQMLLRGGWDPQKGLGPKHQGKMFPVKTILKQDRKGFGGCESKPKITHFRPHDEDAVRTNKDRFRTPEVCVKKKRDLVNDRMKDRQWEMRTRAMMNEGEYS